MLVNRWFIRLGIGSLLLAGCDRAVPSQAKQTTPPTPATTQPAEQASAIIPAATPPVTPAAPVARSFTFVEDNIQRTYAFPHARLHIDKEQKQVVLYSDDPKTAINSNYTGNSYYLVIPLSDDAVDHLDGYQWHFKAASSEQQDSADGIFLDGQRFHVQPSEVAIGFKVDGPDVNVYLKGSFFKFDMNQRQIETGSLVWVEGIVNATVDPAK